MPGRTAGRVTAGLPDTEVVAAPAKINLFLRVLGRRGDGYHDLESLIVRIDLEDRLDIHAHADRDQFRTLSFSFDVAGDAAIVAGVPLDEDNLVLRAARALAEHRAIRGFADITLHKRIPAAAGLGGGSADAAATLSALNRLWACGLPDAELVRLAATIGSDVPALLNDGAVVVAGRGDRVEPVRVAGLDWVLVTFDLEVRTPDAFAWWGEDGGPTGPDPPLGGGRVELLTPNDHQPDLDALAEGLFNDLEGPVVRRIPQIGVVRDRLRGAGAAGSVMCGSGPTVAGLLPSGMRRLDPADEQALFELSGRRPLYVSSRPSVPGRAATGAAD